MTPLGAILLPLGLAGFMISERVLYRLFVFWTLFSASSFANFGEGESGSALQVWMFFGALWLMRLGLDRMSTLSVPFCGPAYRSKVWLIVFAAIACLSLMMPFYLSDRLLIESPYLGNPYETPLTLTSHNVTQLLYLLFGCMIALCTAHVNLNAEVRDTTERTILFAAAFVSVWGIFQFACNKAGIPYPAFIFNNSGSASGQGYLQVLDDIGVGRISSAAVEPSVFAQSLVTLLSLTLPAWLRRGAVISVRFDRWCSILMLLALILSTSSTAYLGLTVLGFLTMWLLVRTRIISAAKALGFASVALIAGILFGAAAIASVPVVREVANSVLLDKSGSASGLERLMTVILAFGYFQKYPILGVGWGSAGSHDLIVKLLSNVGVLGTFAFLAAMISILRANWRALEFLETPESLSRAVWFLALTTFLLTAAIIEFPLAFGNFWLVLGISISTGKSALTPWSGTWASSEK